MANMTTYYYIRIKLIILSFIIFLFSCTNEKNKELHIINKKINKINIEVILLKKETDNYTVWFSSLSYVEKKENINDIKNKLNILKNKSIKIDEQIKEVEKLKSEYRVKYNSNQE